MNKIRVATVFSGIGSVEFALKRLNIDHEIVFACDNGERDNIIYDWNKEFNVIKSLESIDEKHDYVELLYSKLTKKRNYVQCSYLANYPQCPSKRFYQDIRLLDGSDFFGKVDLFVGGSPCQSFSSVGFQHGLEDTRGTLFYEFARLVKEIQPKVFIYENVRNLLKHDKGKTWDIINKVFLSLGYSINYEVLNASDYGIPQTRRRLFVVGYKNGKKKFSIPKPTGCDFKMSDFMIDNCDYGFFTHDSSGMINIITKHGEVDSKYYLSPLLNDYVMKSGTKTWSQKPEINKQIARTLLKTMGNRHRAGVDNYYSADGSNDLGKVRMLTEREAHRLMGYTDDYKIIVSKAQAYKQAGNSIVVDVMMAILNSILKDNVL